MTREIEKALYLFVASKTVSKNDFPDIDQQAFDEATDLLVGHGLAEIFKEDHQEHNVVVNLTEEGVKVLEVLRRDGWLQEDGGFDNPSQV